MSYLLLFVVYFMASASFSPKNNALIRYPTGRQIFWFCNGVKRAVPDMDTLEAIVVKLEPGRKDIIPVDPTDMAKIIDGPPLPSVGTGSSPPLCQSKQDRKTKFTNTSHHLLGIKIYAQRWVKYPNPVFGGGPLGTCFDATLMHSEANNSKYLMYFSWRQKRTIGLTSSMDGIEWSPPVLVTGLTEPNSVLDINRQFVLQVAPHHYKMWFSIQEGDQKSLLYYAQSHDGVHWVQHPEPVLEPIFEWEQQNILCAHVIFVKKLNLYRLWYSAGNIWEPDAIGYATSYDGIHWNRTSKEPIFLKGAIGEWDQSRVTCPNIVHRHGHHYMFYIGFRDMHVAAIGIARSKDGVSGWQRHAFNPIVYPEAGHWDGTSVYKPYTLFNGTHWNLWYNGRQGGLEQIGMASYLGEDFGFVDSEEWESDKWTKETMIVNNSDTVNNHLASWPDTWQQPLVFAAVGDEAFIEGFQLFRESLVAQGYHDGDMLLICVTAACSHALDAQGIDHYASYNSSCDGNIKCLISHAKMSAILTSLQAGVTIMFFDLDVYIKTLPLSAIPIHRDTLILTQNNLDPDFMDRHNFGLFLVRSNPVTIACFEWMVSEFAARGTWDQLLFNQALTNFNVTHQFLDEQKFGLFGWRRYNTSQLHAAHLICVEGASNKLLFGRLFFGPFAHHSHYRPQAGTVTIEYKDGYTVRDLLILLDIAIVVSRALATAPGALGGSQAPSDLMPAGGGRGGHQRYIRLAGWDKYRGTFIALFNADELRKDNVTLVEDNYWAHWEQMNHRGEGSHSAAPLVLEDNNKATVVAMYAGNEADGLPGGLALGLSLPKGETQDIVLSVPNKEWLSTFASEVSTRVARESHVCPLHTRGRHKCLSTCYYTY